MRKLATGFFFAIVMGVGAVMAVPATPALAEDSDCIEQCDADFPGTRPDEVSLRGWCYILRGCWLDVM